jgi:hypothetical protein
MKHNLWLCQATFSECINKAQAATTDSYKIREILPKTITLAGSNMLIACSLVARDTLFLNFKTKLKYVMQIQKSIFLKSNVTRKLKCTSCDSKQQLRHVLTICAF